MLADDAEWAKIVADEGLEDYRAELDTNPRVMYKNLYKWDKIFVSGSVAYKDTDECADGAAGHCPVRRCDRGRGSGQQLRRVRGGQARAGQGIHGDRRPRLQAGRRPSLHQRSPRSVSGQAWATIFLENA